jgi:hypothetical protein
MSEANDGHPIEPCGGLLTQIYIRRLALGRLTVG